MRNILLAALMVVPVAFWDSGQINTNIGPQETHATHTEKVKSTAPLLLGSDEFSLPNTVIVGPSNVKLGRNVVLSVQPFDSKPKGLEKVTYIWDVEPPADDIFGWPDNTKVAFGAGIEDTVIRVKLIAMYLFVRRDEAGAVVAFEQYGTSVSKQIIIGSGDKPKPKPKPDPDDPKPKPDPDDPKPDPKPEPVSKYGLDKFIPGLVSKVKVDPSQLKADAANLSKSFADLKTSIDKGQFAMPVDALRAVRESNNKAVPSTIEQWKPLFESLSQRLAEIKLKELPMVETKTAFEELSAGFAALAK